MDNGLLFVLMIWEGFMLAFLIYLGKAWYDGAGGQKEWGVARGVVERSVYGYGLLTVSYRYAVDGTLYVGNVVATGLRGGAGKSAFLDEKGTMWFALGQETNVYYDREAPEKAVLRRGVAPGIWKTFCVIGVLAAAPFVFMALERNLISGVVLFAWAFTAIGCFVFGLSLYYFYRLARARSYPTARGCLTKAEVRLQSGSENQSGYVPYVEFEYEVDGVRFGSHQRTAINVRTLHNGKEKPQAEIDALQAQPELTVYYDPKAPWDGFLQHGPGWGAWMTLGMAAIFMGVGGFFLWKMGGFVILRN